MFAEAGTEASGEGWRGQDPRGDLHGLLTEIQALRAPPERSSETSSARQSGLQERLATGREEAPGSALASALQTLPVPEQPLQRDKPGTARPLLTICSAALHVWVGRGSFWVLCLLQGAVFPLMSDRCYPQSRGPDG